MGLSYHRTRLRYAETNRRAGTVSCSESEKFEDLLADEAVACWALNGHRAAGWRTDLVGSGLWTWTRVLISRGR